MALRNLLCSGMQFVLWAESLKRIVGELYPSGAGWVDYVDPCSGLPVCMVDVVLCEFLAKPNARVFVPLVADVRTLTLPLSFSTPRLFAAYVQVHTTDNGHILYPEVDTMEVSNNVLDVLELVT